MKNLLLLRKQKGISQAQLSKDLGIYQQVLSRYERGEREADYTTLAKIAKYFDVSIDYLLGESEYYYPDRLTILKLTPEEKELLYEYRSLSKPLQDMLKETIKTWKKSNINKSNKGVIS